MKESSTLTSFEHETRRAASLKRKPHQHITSIITADAVREMQLRKGQTAAALMKSTEVMITRV
ncbi:MAG: TOBE domain-containing protein [Edaphobacter sp.]